MGSSLMTWQRPCLCVCNWLQRTRMQAHGYALNVQPMAASTPLQHAASLQVHTRGTDGFSRKLDSHKTQQHKLLRLKRL